ncbi:MAG: hypothetical protein LBE56_00575 [Tannerella sp.]|jgi:tetratricopeptide (TPR) repeat protein|nr:hypothetical protein [Tannerella sp.]
MKKIFVLILLFTSLCVYAQRNLGYEDRSMDNAVFGGQTNEACVTFSAPTNLKPLFFSSNIQKLPAKIDTIGTDINYHLVFDASKGRESRTISIRVQGFSPLSLSVWLTPKKQLNFFLYDPDSTIVGCYYQLSKEGADFFAKGMYMEAKEKYTSAMQCKTDFKPEYEAVLNQKITIIDSILFLKPLADASFDLLDYKTAYDLYFQIYSYNVDDRTVADRLTLCSQKMYENCKIYFTNAENYQKNGENEKAIELYQRVVDQGCSQSVTANLRIQEIYDATVINKTATTLTYEYEKDAPIGFSIGKYKDRKSNGYFTMRLNSEVFEALRSNNDSLKRPELNISFGWTIKVVKPVWIFFGPGYTGVGKYEAKANANENDELTLKIKSAVSPEIGLLGKIDLSDDVGIAFRYTFQYRFALEKESIDYIGKIKHVIGIGLCF